MRDVKQEQRPGQKSWTFCVCLVRAVEKHRWGPGWLPLRNAALIAVMARAGLRVGEAAALDVSDVEINTRSG